MRSRVLLGLAGLFVLGAAAGIVAWRRRAGTTPDAERSPSYAPPVSAIAGDLLAEQPLARSTDDDHTGRETRYGDELDAEQQERHAAAERLKADPFNDRLHD